MELIQLFPQFYPTTFPLIINSIERPLYGSESTTQHSDTVFNIMKNHPFNIIHYKKKIKAVTNLIFIVSLVVLVVAIFIPWMHSRKIAESTIQFLSNQQILAFSSTVTKSIEDVMTKYELISNFLASLFNDPDIIRCTDDQTVHLIKYVTTASKKLLPKPHQYSETTLIGDLRFCQIDFQEQQTEKFNLFYLYDNNSLDSNVHIREFHQDTDFTIWKPFTDGTHLIDIPKTSVNKSTFLMKQKITHWKYDKSFFDSPQHTQQHMSAVTPIINSSSHQVGLASVSLMTEDISKLIDNHIEESINCKYALLTKDMTVVITSDLGVIKPLRYEGNSPIYPDMKNLNSSFWAKLADKTRFTYNANSPIVVGEKAFQIEIDKVDYLVSISSVNPRNRTITHFFVVAISYNDIIGSAYFELAKGVVFITSVLFLIFYFILWCMKKNHIKRDNRLMKQKPILNSPYNTKMYIDDQGIIGRAIQQVRQLQLLFPEEINFNHVLDETVENLCKQRQKAYETARNSHCLFCNHVVKPKKTHNSNSDYFDTAQKDSFYLIWKKMEFPKIKYKFLPNFQVNDFLADPEKKIVRLIMTIYEEFNAFYSPFDPNSLISLFLYLAQFNKNCFQTAHSLFTLRKFLKGPFNYWITSKEDIFALFFAAFVSPIDFKSIILNSTSSKFSTNDLNSYPNNSQSKNSNDSQKSLELNSSFLYLKPCNLTDELQNSSYRRKLEVLKDYFSNTEHNIEILFSIIERCLPVQRENIHCSRFFTTVKKLIKKTQNKRQFNLLGELRIRIQSPEFTIIDDCYDRCLFMAGLLKISEFASYYENEYLMCFCLERMNEYIFNEKELKESTMISEYHYEFASKIVAPWISLFTNFYPLEEQVKNIQNTIHYWKSKTETDSEP